MTTTNKELKEKLAEKLKNPEILHTRDEETVNYDQETEFIVVGPIHGPTRTFNDWDEAFNYTNNQIYETWFGLILEDDTTATPYAIINRNKKTNPQPINPNRFHPKP